MASDQYGFSNVLGAQGNESRTLLIGEASVYFNVIRVESMTSGVKNVQHQCSMHDYNVLPVSLDTSSSF